MSRLLDSKVGNSIFTSVFTKNAVMDCQIGSRTMILQLSNSSLALYLHSIAVLGKILLSPHLCQAFGGNWLGRDSLMILIKDLHC